jgi:hypothetical protein
LLVDGEYYLDGWGLDDVVEVVNWFGYPKYSSYI